MVRLSWLYATTLAILNQYKTKITSHHKLLKNGAVVLAKTSGQPHHFLSTENLLDKM